MIYVDIARSPGSTLRVLTTSERLANQLKINEIGEVGKLVTKIELDAPKSGKLLKKNEMGDPTVGKIGEVGKLVKKNEMGGMKVGELVKKIQMNDPKVGKVGTSVIFGHQETKLEQDAILAGAEKVDQHPKYNVTPFDTKWVDIDKAFQGEPIQIRARILTREFKRCMRELPR